MDVFESCKRVEALLSEDENKARTALIKILHFLKKNEIEYDPLVNHLLRKTGLYPYIKEETAIWEDRFLCEAFKADTGSGQELVLHREQSFLLKKLLEGKNIAVSAPTSFGKSFVIDAFISIKNPSNVVIIVPTIALMDETRRRIYKKFSHAYKIITTSDDTLDDKNIFIFPQERVLQYVNKIDQIDILIIDEFYKASRNLDKERSSSLIKAILMLDKKSKQKYFLAPNISDISENIVTKNVEFLKLDFNTVFLKQHDVWKDIKNTDRSKDALLLDILEKEEKTLVYAGTYSSIDDISKLVMQQPIQKETKLLSDFANWLEINYGQDYILSNLVRKGIGIHNGRLHRSLAQVQVRLFDDENGLDTIISTSSIIEGVNTAAKNVVIWKNKNGAANLNIFTFKNIMGRAGRMFRYFIGDIYIMDKPIEDEEVRLDVPFPEEILGGLDKDEFSNRLPKNQIAKIVRQDQSMSELLGYNHYKRLKKERAFQSNDVKVLKDICSAIKSKPQKWRGLGYLNSNNPEKWENLLYEIIRINPSKWGGRHEPIVKTIKILEQNWQLSIPEIIYRLSIQGISIQAFFKIERTISFKLSALLNDFNIIQKILLPDLNCDLSPFIAKCSYVFLPKLVYQLEEFGLPRMISKKIVNERIIDLENAEMNIHQVIHLFNTIGRDKLKSYSIFDDFDRYIIDHFFDGITSNVKIN